MRVDDLLVKESDPGFTSRYYVLRRARKDKLCRRCGRVIKRGELYVVYHYRGYMTRGVHDNVPLCVDCMVKDGVLQAFYVLNAKKLYVYLRAREDGRVVEKYLPDPRPLTQEMRRELQRILESGKKNVDILVNG